MTATKRASSPNLFFLRQFLSRPGMVGSIIPTSQLAVRALLDPVDWSNVRCIVEYGPGTGVFTRELLRRIGPEARLIAIDTNEVFIDYLRSAINDPRLVCVHGSAADVESILADNGHGNADYVISGLPFSTLPRAIADLIMDATHRAIRTDGGFLIYQYSRFVLPLLGARFSSVDVSRAWRCIPPAWLFWAWKRAGSVSSASSGESLAAE